MSHSEAPPRVLLTDTSRWPCAARLAINLAGAGVAVSAVCSTSGHPLLKIKSVPQVFNYDAFRPLRSLTAAIQATRPHTVIPCDDRAVQHLHELYYQARALHPNGNEITALIERSLGCSESYGVVSSRHELLKMAHEEGIRVPATKSVTTIDDLDCWSATQKYPWVLKADGTWGGRGVKFAKTAEDAKRMFLQMQKMFGLTRAAKRLLINRDPFWVRPWLQHSTPAVIVQSYIPGRPANCAVLCCDGEVLAAIGVEVLSAQGPTEPATVVRVVENAEMMLAAERLARKLHLSGFFGLDFVISNEDGWPYLIEMNPRATPLCHLRLGKKRDLIGALRTQFTNQEKECDVSITENSVIAYFPQALQCNAEMLHSSFLDIPSDEPELIDELLHPWPERTLYSQAFRYLEKIFKRNTNPDAIDWPSAPITDSTEEHFG